MAESAAQQRGTALRGLAGSCMALNEWKKLVAAQISSSLKQRGFRKNGIIFSSARQGVVLIIGLQSSHVSTQDTMKITCNLGIWVEKLADRPKPNIWGCHWRMRIGEFLPEPRDHWWTVTSDDSAAQAGNEMLALLEERALPEMEGLATPEALKAFWSAGRFGGLTERSRQYYLARLSQDG